MCIYIYIYIHIHSAYYIHVCVCMYVYIYIERERDVGTQNNVETGTHVVSNTHGRSPNWDSGFQRILPHHNINFQGWKSPVHREFSRSFESANLSLEHLSMETGRTSCRTSSAYRRSPPRGTSEACSPSYLLSLAAQCGPLQQANIPTGLFIQRSVFSTDTGMTGVDDPASGSALLMRRRRYAAPRALGGTTCLTRRV